MRRVDWDVDRRVRGRAPSEQDPVEEHEVAHRRTAAAEDPREVGEQAPRSADLVEVEGDRVVGMEADDRMVGKIVGVVGPALIVARQVGEIECADAEEFTRTFAVAGSDDWRVDPVIAVFVKKPVFPLPPIFQAPKSNGFWTMSLRPVKRLITVRPYSAPWKPGSSGGSQAGPLVDHMSPT